MAALAGSNYDLLVVGGGIFGVCAAWDASLRGLRVALIDKGDFCSGVSANSYKIVHGGIRYIQHLDVPRVRASCRERSALLRIAPHLVQPLPTLIPTYRSLRKGKLLLGAGMYLYDLLTLDRNTGIPDPARRIPWSRFLTREQLLDAFPSVPADGLTGAAVFCDAQMYNPTRLAWSILESAIAAGARTLSYCRATGLRLEHGRAAGCSVRDELAGQDFYIGASAVLNAAGPWAEEVFAHDLGRGARRGVYSRDAYFMVRRRFPGPYAIALPGQSSDADAVLGRGARHLFIVPWRDRTLIGVWHVVYDRPPDEVELGDAELKSFIDEVNHVYPGMNLELDDVVMRHAGLVPFGEHNQDQGALSFGKRSLIVDHEREDGIAGLVSLIGIRYTMGRGDAQAAIDMLCRKQGWPTRRPATHRIPVASGDIADFEALVARVAAAAGPAADQHMVRALAHNHGSRFERVLAVAAEDGARLEPIGPDTTVTAAELRYAARREQVCTLGDAVLRRTDLATGGHPGQETLARAAAVVGDELGWSEARIAAELAQLDLARIAPAAARPSPAAGAMIAGVQP